MNETPILQALQTAVIAAVAASTMPALPIKAVARTWTPPNDSKYLEIVQIVNNMENEYWGEERVYRGILRLILHWPIDDAGAYPAMTVRDSVASFFTKSRTLWQSGFPVKVSDHPSAGSLIEAGADNLFPVSIPYRSFRS